MLYVISKETFGDYNVRDIQSNSCWCECVLDGYASIPDELVEGILATQGYCDIVLNEDQTEVVSFTAREIPDVPVPNTPIYSCHLEVTVDAAGMASHSASEINAHIDAGGSVVLNFTGYSNPSYAQLWFRHNGGVMFCTTDVTDSSVSQTLFGIDEEKNCTEEHISFEGSGSSGKTFASIKVTEHTDGRVTMENTFTDGSKETMVLAAGEKPESLTYNGVAIPIEWATEAAEGTEVSE